MITPEGKRILWALAHGNPLSQAAKGVPRKHKVSWTLCAEKGAKNLAQLIWICFKDGTLSVDGWKSTYPQLQPPLRMTSSEAYFMLDLLKGHVGGNTFEALEVTRQIISQNLPSCEAKAPITFAAAMIACFRDEVSVQD